MSGLLSTLTGASRLRLPPASSCCCDSTTALDLCAYRIIQEALTNAIKHAGPARAEVHISWGHDALELEIVDDGRNPSAGNGASGGHGIAGMRERAALHGGNIQAGAGVEGGFAVRARLPLAPERGR